MCDTGVLLSGGGVLFDVGVDLSGAETLLDVAEVLFGVGIDVVLISDRALIHTDKLTAII